MPGIRRMICENQRTVGSMVWFPVLTTGIVAVSRMALFTFALLFSIHKRIVACNQMHKARMCQATSH